MWERKTYVRLCGAGLFWAVLEGALLGTVFGPYILVFLGFADKSYTALSFWDSLMIHSVEISLAVLSIVSLVLFFLALRRIRLVTAS